jgi:hypothetical protein
MSFLLLPSARLSFYEISNKTLKVYPIKAEELINLSHPQSSKTILSYLKTLNIYQTNQLKEANHLS